MGTIEIYLTGTSQALAKHKTVQFGANKEQRR